MTECQTTFTGRDVHQAVAAWAGDRLSAAQIRGLAESFLADPSVVLCGTGERIRARHVPEAEFTTEAMLEAEDNLLAFYRQARTDHGAEPLAVVPALVVAAAIAAVSASLADEGEDPSGGLSDEQGELVRAVTGSGDGIRCAIGPAGTGETEAIRATGAACGTSAIGWWAAPTGEPRPNSSGPGWGSIGGGAVVVDPAERRR